MSFISPFQMKCFILFFLFFIITSSPAQFSKSPDRPEFSLHLVEFIDKDYTPFSLFVPQEYLSPKALNRRAIQGVSIDELDLPIDPNYIKSVLQLGVELHSSSRWFNAIAIHCESISTLEKIAQLPFVKNIRPLGKYREAKEGKIFSKRPEIDSSKHQESYYGLAENQIKMIGGIPLHDLGFTGQGVHVAIVDGGYSNAYRMSVFDSLYLENRLLGTHDFVDGDDFIYESSTHGTNVLSIMASKRPNLIVGTAPDAAYYLFKTEDVQGEYKVEEFNWVVAMEYADSVGVDVVNSSMGYSRFDEPSMSYKYTQLDGQTAMITQGATIAVSRGLLIVNSVGNDGAKDWHYLFAPADAVGIIAVGAVEREGQRTDFSSWGPTIDQRVKPDISAQGGNTAYASMMAYDVGYGDGTSYSSPVMAGMFASFKQAFPDKTNVEIKEAVFQSAHQANHPDVSLGYGIPNFFAAFLQLSNPGMLIDEKGKISTTVQFVKNDFPILLQLKKATLELEVYDLWGKRYYEEKMSFEGSTIYQTSIPNMDSYEAGIYVLKITLNGKTDWIKFAVGS